MHTFNTTIVPRVHFVTPGFLYSQIELDISPQKGWTTDNLVVPAGMQITSRISGDEDDSEPEGGSMQAPGVYPYGVGNILMNGCYGTGYELGDPCYDLAKATDSCLVNNFTLEFIPVWPYCKNYGMMFLLYLQDMVPLLSKKPSNGRPNRFLWQLCASQSETESLELCWFFNIVDLSQFLYSPVNGP